MTTKIELNYLRNQAFGKLKTYRRKFDEEEINRIIDICESGEDAMSPDYHMVVAQIIKDIRTQYKKYDCLAMWTDTESGISAYEPELIKRIAVEVGGLTCST